MERHGGHERLSSDLRILFAARGGKSGMSVFLSAIADKEVLAGAVKLVYRGSYRFFFPAVPFAN